MRTGQPPSSGKATTKTTFQQLAPPPGSPLQLSGPPSAFCPHYTTATPVPSAPHVSGRPATFHPDLDLSALLGVSAGSQLLGRSPGCSPRACKPWAGPALRPESLESATEAQRLVGEGAYLSEVRSRSDISPSGTDSGPDTAATLAPRVGGRLLITGGMDTGWLVRYQGNQQVRGGGTHPSPRLWWTPQVKLLWPKQVRTIIDWSRAKCACSSAMWTGFGWSGR